MPRSLIKWLICALLCSLPMMGARAQVVGTVYAMTNALNSAGGNQILVFGRNSNGSLTLLQTAATEGGGPGMQLSGVDTLGSQSSLTLDGQHHMLFAVNTESLAANSQDCQEGTITSFIVGANGTLTIANRVASGGMFPNSLSIASTSAGPVLYVLNAGGPGACSQPGLTGVPNITGFSVDASGKMTLLADSVQAINPGPLNGTGSGENCPPTTGAPLSPQASFFCGLNPPAFARSPAEVRFTPDATKLLVTVKGTNSIYVFPVSSSGIAGVPTIFQAPGPALPSYFGFTFDSNEDLLVTELFGTATSIPSGGAGAVSSFSISSTGSLAAINQHVTNGGTATCWIAVEPTTGKYAYASNNLSNTIALYSVGSGGSLTLINGNAAPATTNGPNDLVIVGQDANSSYLYELNAGDGTIGAFQINLANGSLTSVGSVSGLPVDTSAQGLTGYSAPYPTPLVAAVLPTSRSVEVGSAATAFATIINTGSAAANACSISPAPSSNPPFSFNYQTTNSSTNTLTGTANTPATIAAGGSQSFLIALSPTAAISPTQENFSFGCANQLPAATTTDVDTLLLTSATTPVPDIISLAATASGDGILHLPGTGGSNAFVVATDNAGGASGVITANANTGSATLPVSLTICQTNPATSACINPPAASTTVTISPGNTPTFAVFGQASGSIPLNAATNRVIVQFTDSNAVVRGSTSVAVATQ